MFDVTFRVLYPPRPPRGPPHLQCNAMERSAAQRTEISPPRVIINSFGRVSFCCIPRPLRHRFSRLSALRPSAFPLRVFPAAPPTLQSTCARARFFSRFSATLPSSRPLPTCLPAALSDVALLLLFLSCSTTCFSRAPPSSS